MEVICDDFCSALIDRISYKACLINMSNYIHFLQTKFNKDECLYSKIYYL